MRITRLHLHDFRNYGVWELSPDEDLTVLVGPNAAGKTNVLEAIQLVTTGRSFRQPRWEDVVRSGADTALVRMEAAGATSQAEAVLEIEASGTRRFRVNGVLKRRVSDATGIVPSVIFTPDDLAMVKGSAEGRRQALDDAGEQLSKTFGAVRKDYSRVVRHRNRALKDGAPDAELAPWDDQLVRLGSRLLVHRARLLKRIAVAAADVYGGVAEGEGLSVDYESAVLAAAGSGAEWPPEASEIEPVFAKLLETRRGDERTRMTTLVGPHRDDVAFGIGGVPARRGASQGQQRTVALAWKLAELKVAEEVLGKRPVLLLDDVMSELDEKRRGALVSVVRSDIQTFITTTNLGYFAKDLTERAAVVPLPPEPKRAAAKPGRKGARRQAKGDGK